MNAPMPASRSTVARMLGRVAAFDPGLAADVAAHHEGQRRQVDLLRVRCHALEDYAVRLEQELAAGLTRRTQPITGDANASTNRKETR